MGKKVSQTNKTSVNATGANNTNNISACQFIISLLGRKGFLGLEPIGKLMANNCKDIPKEPGIYLILRSNIDPPSFLQTQLSRNYYNILQSQRGTLTLQGIMARWVNNCYILAIGFGNNLKTSGLLFANFGNWKTTHTCAAKYIWTLDDCRELLFCWIPLPKTCNLKNTKKWLLQEFNKYYGSNPFAVG